MTTAITPDDAAEVARTGTIHTFRTFAEKHATAAHLDPLGGLDVPVVVRSAAVAAPVGTGRLVGARFRGPNLVGTIRWPAGLEERVGKGQPIATPEFADDGSIRRVLIELEDDHDCDCDDCQAGGECPDHDHETPAGRTMSTSSDEYQIILENLAARKYDGDIERTARALIKQNKRLGEQVQELKEAAPAIPDGHVAVSQADVDALAAYRALNADPIKLKATIDTLTTERDAIASERDASVGELGGLRREKSLAEVAGTLKYKPSVLAKLPGVDAMEFVPVARKSRGQEVASFDVKTTDAEGKEVVRPIEEVEKAEWAEWMPALKAGQPAAQQGQPSGHLAPRPGLAPATGYRPEPRPVTRQASNADEDPSARALSEVRRLIPSGI